jgi:hypothetical protein
MILRIIQTIVEYYRQNIKASEETQRLSRLEDWLIRISKQREIQFD